MSPVTAGLIGAVIGFGVKWVMEEIDRAPDGWQDSDGWHEGEGVDEDDTSEWAERERPSPMPACTVCGHGYYQHDENDAKCHVRPNYPTIAARCPCTGYTLPRTERERHEQ